MLLNHPYPSQQIAQVLQALPSLQYSQHNHEYVVATLRSVINEQPYLVHLNIGALALYLKNNLKSNQSILISLECLVLLHSQLNNSLRRQLSSILQEKYQCVNLSSQISKLKATNTDLIEPFLYLISRLAQWYELEVEEKQFKNIDHYQSAFLLEYAYTIVDFEFKERSYLEGADIDYCMLTIYRMLTEDHQFLAYFLKNLQMPRKLALSIFYFFGSYSFQDPDHVYMIFHSMSKLLSLLIFHNIDVRQTVVKQLLPKIRNKTNRSENETEQTVNSIQNAMTAMLALRWSVESQNEWSSISWILWDLLEIDSQKQVWLISDLVYNAKELMKSLELF